MKAAQNTSAGNRHYPVRGLARRQTAEPVALGWRRSTASLVNGECVEVRSISGGVAVRDSFDRRGPELRCSAYAWQAFVAGIKGKKLVRLS